MFTVETQIHINTHDSQKGPITNKDLKILLLCTAAPLALVWNVLKENIRIESTQIVSDCYK